MYRKYRIKIPFSTDSTTFEETKKNRWVCKGRVICGYIPSLNLKIDVYQQNTAINDEGNLCKLTNK